MDPPPEECPDSQHRHNTETCGADHPVETCIQGIAVTSTGTWTNPVTHTGEDADGHGDRTLPGCPDDDDDDDDGPVAEVCISGQHSHAAAVPGGHTGCRPAHTAPSCTWSSDGSWSPGHGGPAGDGHATTTGLRVCVRARDWCANDGLNAFIETVDRQSGHIAPDDTGLLTSSPHRDRIPYGRRNLRDAQFTPSLTVQPAGGSSVRSPAQIHLAPGQWATLAYSVPSGNRTSSLRAEAYDYDNTPNRWRYCGAITWTRALTGAVAGSALETSGSRVRFPAGSCILTAKLINHCNPTP